MSVSSVTMWAIYPGRDRDDKEVVDRGERELHPRQVNVHRRRPPVREASLPMALSSLGFLTAMVLTRGIPAHRPDVGIAGVGAVLADQIHPKQGMPRARPVAMVDP
jgi:hypothetical protein